MRRVALVMVLLLVLGAGALLVMRGQGAARTAQSDAAVVEDSTVVERGDLLVTVSGTGTLRPARQASLSFELSAPVAAIEVREGQAVTAGQVLARLEAADLENAVLDAQLALDAQQISFEALTTPARDVDIAVARAAVNAALASAAAASLGASAEDVQIAELQAEIARNQLYQQQLQRDLATGGDADNVPPVLTQLDYNVQLADVNALDVQNQPSDVAALSAANAQLVAAQVQLDRLLNGPSEIELQLAETRLAIAQSALEQAQANLARAVLVAPFDGVVARSNLVIGERPPQGAAIELIDLSSYYVDVTVDETDIVAVQIGQRAKLTLDALPGVELNGHITRVAQIPTVAGQLVSYTVRITLDATDAPVRVGMSATATIVVNELRDVLLLPNRFIRIDRATQQAFVTVQDDSGRFVDQPVVLGVRSETETQIVSGLTAGQRVLLLPRGTFNPLGGS